MTDGPVVKKGKIDKLASLRAQRERQAVEIVSSAVTLPDPASATVADLTAACIRVRERRHELVGNLDIGRATEFVRQASAIEKYLSKTKMAAPASHAARVLERAVGAALGPAEETHGSRTDLDSSLMSEEFAAIPKDDRHRFRLMHEYGDVWDGELEKEKKLSRRKVLSLIKEARQADEIDLTGAVDLVQGDAVEFLESLERASVDLLLTDPPYRTEFMEMLHEKGIIRRVTGW